MLLRCYYAHPMSIYGTPQEARDVELLQSLGFDVVNPSTLETDDMDEFCNIAAGCDLVAFRALPDGSISCGVAEEISSNSRVIELPAAISRRSLTLEQTLQALAESGQR